MTPEKTWHAVYTRPGCEKKVSQLLSSKDIECYCALTRSNRSARERRQAVHPLFTSYVFVRIYDYEKEMVKRTRGVVNFVYWLSNPVVIGEEEIEAMKYFLHEHENVKLEQIKINSSERVHLTEGPVVFSDEVSEHKKQSVRVTLPSLGFAMVAELRVGNVEVIRQSKELVAKIA